MLGSAHSFILHGISVPPVRIEVSHGFAVHRGGVPPLLRASWSPGRG